MKTTLLFACAALFVASGVSLAGPGGLNLGWSDCGGPENRLFACNTNVGRQVLVGSFVAPAGLTGPTAIEVVIDLQGASASLPDWWQVHTGGCRQGHLASNFDFTLGPFTCVDYWQGGAVGYLFMDAPAGSRARIRGVAALPVDDPHIGPIPEGDEVYAFQLILSNQKTLGTGSCPGCNVGVCIVLNSIRILQGENQGNAKLVTAPASRSFATWQGGIGVGCYFATPARNAAWGSIKALYRD